MATPTRATLPRPAAPITPIEPTTNTIALDPTLPTVQE